MKKTINFIHIKVKGKYQNNRGAVSVINAVLIASLIMVAAFVIDFGVASAMDAKIQNGVDASALAGGLYLRESEALARSKAEEIALLNGLVDGEYQVNIDMVEMTVEVTTTRQYNTGLARVFNINKIDIGARSKVKLAPVGSISGGIKPLAVQVPVGYGYGDEEDFFSFEESVDIKLNGSDNTNGNFGALSLGGTGASVYLDNLLNGYDGSLAEGDTVNTNPGSMVSIINPVRDLIETEAVVYEAPYPSYDSVRMWTIPVVNFMDVNGASPVEIIGFAVFYIESIGNQSGQTVISGKYIEMIIPGSSSETAGDYGASSVMIIE